MKQCMRVIRYHEFGDENVLQLEEMQSLTPEADEVSINVQSIGVNPCDTLRRQGLWDDELPLIPGSDIAGIIEEVGDHVIGFNVGDRVFGTVPHLNVTGARGDRQGTYAESVVVREDRLTLLPEGVSFDVGAGLGLVGITAYRALFHFGELEPGQTCFVHGGSGGVGHVAVQLAAAVGATVIATTSPQNAEVVTNLGANIVLNYGKSDLRSALNGQDADAPDVILDHRLGEYMQFDIDIAAKNGTVVAIGGNYDTPKIEDLTEAIGKDLTIQPMDMFNEPDIAGVLERLTRLLEKDLLTTKVARSYDLEDAAAAHRDVVGDSFVGKLVIHP